MDRALVRLRLRAPSAGKVVLQPLSKIRKIFTSVPRNMLLPLVPCAMPIHVERMRISKIRYIKSTTALVQITKAPATMTAACSTGKSCRDAAWIIN